MIAAKVLGSGCSGKTGIAIINERFDNFTAKEA
jgi:hypothetical protein